MALMRVTIEGTVSEVLTALNELGGCQMSSATDALNAIAASVDTLTGDVQRLITVLQGQDLSSEAQALVDSIQTKLTALDTAVDTAAPVPPVPA
jgi:uncharacterized protein YoxC